MTALKYLLLIILGWMISGWSAPMWAKTDADASATASDTTSADTGTDQTATTHKTSHHRKHKGAKKASDDTAAAAKDTTAPAASTATTTATAKTTAADTTSNPTADATPKATTAKSSRKKKHGKSETAETATTTNAASATTAAPEKTQAPAGKTGTTIATKPETVPAKPEVKTETKSETKSEAKTTPAPTPVVTQAATTTNAASATAPGVTAETAKTDVAKGSHRRHHGKGKAADEAAVKTNAPPNPPITITPSSVPLQDQQNPITNVTPATAVTPATLPGGTFGPTVQTGLPVARPGAGTTANLPTGVIPDKASAAALKKSHHVVVPPVVATFPFTDYAPAVRKPPTHTYPWKSNIITTVFWIGEGSSSISSTDNYKSAWNQEWIRDNGGIDSQDDLNGYASSLHASTLNPFYIALPFNDLAYPDKARRWLPAGWSRPPRDGKQVSACQDRWIEIKARNGRICFAQWEDVGPLRYDHAEYVFGDERPNTLTHAGLDVSPAVALYLGIDRHGSGLTSWRFVDDADVLPGMWLKYDEQALLFKELKERARHPKSNPRIQDLAQPTPDDSSQDANQRKAGAARG